MNEFREQLRSAIALGIQGGTPLDIDLSIAVKSKEYNISGNFFYILNAPDYDSYIEVSVNGSNRPSISWTKQMGFMGPFNKLYISTPTGQAGIMTIVYAAEAPQLFDIIDNRSAISGNLQDILDELRGDVIPENWGEEKTVSIAAVEILATNVYRKGASLQAKSTNTHSIYIGYDNTVSPTKWVYELQAGQQVPIDDKRVPLYAIAMAADQKLGWGEW